jgi:putative ABC transport system permease protein
MGVTLVMAGVYRGMVDDGKALLDNSGADLWVVQQGHAGALRRTVQHPDDTWRALLTMPGVAEAANVTYLTMQVRHGGRDVRAMVVGIVPGEAWGVTGLAAARWWPGAVTRGHYEAVADIATGFRAGRRMRIRRNATPWWG